VVEGGGGHARATRVVDVHERALVVGELHHRPDALDRHQLVGDGEAREDHERHSGLALEGPRELVDAHRVDEPRAGQ
jgi:hypothetical protein